MKALLHIVLLVLFLVGWKSIYYSELDREIIMVLSGGITLVLLLGQRIVHNLKI